MKGVSFFLACARF
uniref:Uncharacterized protein n=1 Tax=Rhizophora mucronata TaxID=61149 RepID=A0A2P2PGN6_RHIMU